MQWKGGGCKQIRVGASKRSGGKVSGEGVHARKQIEGCSNIEGGGDSCDAQGVLHFYEVEELWHEFTSHVVVAIVLQKYGR